MNINSPQRNKVVEHITGKKSVSCDKCKYTWLTKSTLNNVSCPSCLGKVKVNI